jgi:hypothetical protein
MWTKYFWLEVWKAGVIIFLCCAFVYECTGELPAKCDCPTKEQKR